MSLLTRLRSLSLWNCLRITEEGLACLAGLGLHQLSLRGCQQLGNAALSHIAQLPALQQLNLAACERISGADHAQVAQGEASDPQVQVCGERRSTVQLLSVATAQSGCLQAHVRGC